MPYKSPLQSAENAALLADQYLDEFEVLYSSMLRSGVISESLRNTLNTIGDEIVDARDRAHEAYAEACDAAVDDDSHHVVRAVREARVALSEVRETLAKVSRLLELTDDE